MSKKKDRSWTIATIGLLFCIVVLGFFLKDNIERKFLNYDRKLPRIDIELNGVSLEEIKGGSKETKYEGNELALDNGGQIIRFDNVEVKGRGNSTWEQSKPKRPYQIKFTSKVDLLGLGKAKKWVLLANYAEHSYLRSDIAFKLAEMLEIDFNHRGEYVELYFDGEYEGLYYLIQKIEITKSSVDLNEDDGVLFELDNAHLNIEDEEYYKSYLGNYLVFKDMKSKDEGKKKKAVNGFLSDFNMLEIAAKKEDFKTVSEIIDVESFAKYYLMSEFTVNPDAYTTSFYLYRDGENDTIHAGPVWDFDLALANRKWAWEVDGRFYSPTETMIRRREAFGEDGLTENKYISKLMYYLMEMPEFREEVESVFRDKMMGRAEELLKTMQNKKNEIRRAVFKNNKKWGVEDSEEEYEYLLDWVKKRYEYFESEYGG